MLTVADIPLVDVTEVKTLPGYRIEVAFEDGKRGVFDMTPYLDKGVFRTLRNPSVFDAASLGLGTVRWPGDIDIAPERLYTDCEPIA